MHVTCSCECVRFACARAYSDNSPLRLQRVVILKCANFESCFLKFLWQLHIYNLPFTDCLKVSLGFEMVEAYEISVNY